MRRKITIAFSAFSLTAAGVVFPLAPVAANPIIQQGAKAVGEEALRQITKQILSTNNADYLTMAFGYATPLPDADLHWTVGRDNRATARDIDVAPPPSTGESTGRFTPGLFGFFVESDLDPYLRSDGNFFNAVRTYNEGRLTEQAATPDRHVASGTGVIAVPIDIKNLPFRENFKFDVITGKIESFDPIIYGGAQFLNGQWVYWDPRTETDSTMSSYLEGSFSPNSISDIPSFQVPSTNELFSAAEAIGAVNWFPFFLSALNSATTFMEDGELVADLFFDVPVTAMVTEGDRWFASNEALGAGMSPTSVPEPPSMFYFLFALGALAALGWRRGARSSLDDVPC